jgi:hypothetical protein
MGRDQGFEVTVESVKPRIQRLGLRVMSSGSGDSNLGHKGFGVQGLGLQFRVKG